MKQIIFVLTLFVMYFDVASQSNRKGASGARSAESGRYLNPVLHADYSDPDAIRVGDDYYMISSSFNHVPGLPLLHSRDLVHWELIGHALQRLVPEEHFSTVRHGGGVWAPSIRHHNGEFYIFYPDPDFGVYMIKAPAIEGPWSAPVLVLAGKGIIDPCPLWDEDGKAWLVHAYAGSRAGIKSVIAVCPLAADGAAVAGQSRIVYDGHADDPTVEGPKFYKRNGWYYIFAPAGGVSTGWQIVLRSRSVYGPYERKIVMAQGTTSINGPHQGAWVNTPDGADWFLHFQDLEAYGRIVHLQPMKWKADWPIIGADADGDGIGEPVAEYTLPIVEKQSRQMAIPMSDEFNGAGDRPFGLQWQWQANPKSTWAFAYDGQLRLYAQTWPDSLPGLWMAPHLLMQKFPEISFDATCLMDFKPRATGDLAGLTVFGIRYEYIGVQKTDDGLALVVGQCDNGEKAKAEQLSQIALLNHTRIWLRLAVNKQAEVQFFYSENGRDFKKAGQPFMALPGKWVGAKMGLFCNQKEKSNDAGFVDVDWFRVRTGSSVN